MIEFIISALVTNTVVLIVLGFLFKTIINHFLSKDISAFKIKLESDAKYEMQKYKANIEKENIRLKISYGGIFEKQANAIVEIYSLLLQFESKLILTQNLIEDKTSVRKEFYESYLKLFDYYEVNKILLPEDVEEHFGKIKKDIYLAVRSNMRIEDQLNRPYLLKDGELEKLFEQQENKMAIIEQLPQIKSELISKFRSTIGVNYKD